VEASLRSKKVIVPIRRAVL